MNRKLKRTAFIVVYEYSPTVMAFIMRNNRCGERRREGKNKTKKTHCEIVLQFPM